MTSANVVHVICNNCHSGAALEFPGGFETAGWAFTKPKGVRCPACSRPERRVRASKLGIYAGARMYETAEGGFWAADRRAPVRARVKRSTVDRRLIPNRRAIFCHVCGAEAPTGTCAYCRKAEYGE